MTNVLDTLADRLELTDLVARISRAVDRGDVEGIAACYTEDSLDDHGGFKGTGAEFAKYIAGGGSSISNTAKNMLHALGQSLFEIDGDEAFGETAFTFTMKQQDDSLFYSYGRYVDYFKQVDGTWLLHYRRVVTDWAGGVDGTPFASPEWVTSTRGDRSDPVYDRKRSPNE
jgi:hypothetical protein